MLHFIRNERGVLLPAAMLLLFVVCLSIFATTSAYVSKYQTYDSLEKSNIDAAIQKIEMQKIPYKISFFWLFTDYATKTIANKIE